MHTHIWSFDAGYCKIKTARQKKRLQKEDFDKQLLRLNRQQDELLQIKHKLPLIPLPEPYQKGWKRTFVLREDTTHSRQAVFYTTLLSKINTVNYATAKHFRQKLKRKKNRKKQYAVTPQWLREFYTWEWHRSKLSPEEKAHFYPKECWSKDGKTKTVKYVFAEPWRFVLHVTPNIITHTRMVDEVLEQELQQIANYIDGNHLSPRILKLTLGRGWRPDYRFSEKAKYKNLLNNKPLYRILEEAAQEIS